MLCCFQTELLLNSLNCWLAVSQRLLGRKSPTEEMMEWHRRAEELRQYFERVFRLATVRRKVDLAQLVRWIDKDDGQPLFAGTLSQGSGER